MNYHAYRDVSRSQYRKHYDHLRHRGIPTSLVPADKARDGGVPPAGDEAVPYSLAVPPVLDDGQLVAPGGAVRRIRALIAIGWTRADIAPRIAPANCDSLARGNYARMAVGRWRAVAACYDELHMTLGPSKINRQRAIKLGYAPPLAWDDIDDPDEMPSGARTAARRTIWSDSLGGTSSATSPERTWPHDVRRPDRRALQQAAVVEDGARTADARRGVHLRQAASGC